MRLSKDKNKMKGTGMRTAKECALLAVLVSALIAAQLVLSAVPGVEAVTVLFVSYAFAAGWKRASFAATAFSLLRQIVFGVFPVVLVLYLIYYNLLALAFGLLGEKVREPKRSLWLIVLCACLSTACFTLLDNVLTPLWYGYSARAIKLYLLASLPVMISQIVCAALSVSLLFLPLFGVFKRFFPKN